MSWLEGLPIPPASPAAGAVPGIVSAVIPVRNRARLVGRAIRSALAQGEAVLEVIVVDDASTDGTPEAVEEWGRSDPRVRLIVNPERRGAQGSRKAGVHAARGAWVAFLDSDDEWLPGSLDARLAVADREGARVVHAEGLVARPEEPAPVPFGIPPLAGDVYKEILARPGPAFPALLVRREALSAIGELDDAIESYDEWDTAICLAKRYRFGFVPTPAFIWHRHEGETMSKDLSLEARGYEQVTRKHRREIARVAGADALADHYNRAAVLHEQAGDPKGRRRCFLKAIAANPFSSSALQRLGRLVRPPR